MTDDVSENRSGPRGARRWLWIAGITVALIVVASAWTARRPHGAPASEQVLRVASQKGSTKAMLTASGALEGVPYRIEWAEFPAAQHLLEAVGAGAVDCGLVGDAPFQFAYQAGSPIKAVQAIRYKPQSPATAILVPAGSPAQKDTDLRGRRIATGRGSAGHYMLLRALERAGLKVEDVTIVFLAPSDANAAFSSGAIDAWATWNPYLGAAVLHGGARILVDGNGLSTGTGFMAAGTGAIETKRAMLEDLLRRNARALAWATANTGIYAEVLSKETGLPLDVARYTANRTLIEAIALDDGVLAEQRDVLAHFTAAGTLRAERDFAQGFDATLFRLGADGTAPEKRASAQRP